VNKMLGATALAGALALTLTACGEAPEEAASSGSSAAASGAGSDYKGCMVSDAGGFQDQSFNQSGYEGLIAAKDDLGIQEQTAESAVESDYSANINAMVSAGCNQIIGVGFLLADAVSEAAEANPDTHFALVDSAVDPARENVKPLLFDTAQASFLAGYAAAATSETGTVATYGGIKLPSVTIFMDGFVDGVSYYNQEKSADVKVLGWDKAAQDGSFTGDFDDAAKGSNTTQNFIDAGADVILPVAGPVGAGTLSAARAATDAGNPVKVIWVDSDGYDTQAQYKDLILTSVVKEIGAAVKDSIAADVDGDYSADPYVGTLENGGIALAPFHAFEATLPEGLTDELSTIQDSIISGDISVQSQSSPSSSAS
jgi:basic membrane protein A